MTGPAPRDRVAVDGPLDPRDLAGTFGHRSSVAVRFSDADSMGHVNNAVYLTFVEQARIGWWTERTGEPLEREPGRALGLILAEVEVAFRSPVFFGEAVVIETRPTSLGRTSLGLEHRLSASRAGGPARLVATVRSVIVRYDYATERPAPWPAELIEAIEETDGALRRA